MTYEELLQDYNWKKKRQLILERDHHFCQVCQNAEIKSISKKASYVKTIKEFQTYDDDGSLFPIRNDYELLFRDDLDGTEYQTYVALRNAIIFSNYSSQYNIFYSLEINPIDGADKIYINYIEDKSKPESKQHIYVRGLHVHHNYYQDEKLPWEYPDTALKTLCWICHEKYHANEKVDWLDCNGNKKGVLTPCDKCHGTGDLPQYRHVKNGVCFNCYGARFIEFFKY